MVLHQAREEDIEPVTLEQLDAAVNLLSGKKAKGIDAMGPPEVQRLPAPARRELVELYAKLERDGIWPPQLFAVVGAVAPKPRG
eukprot:160579-Pyramimonas_sp.AAC.1